MKQFIPLGSIIAMALFATIAYDGIEHDKVVLPALAIVGVATILGLLVGLVLDNE